MPREVEKKIHSESFGNLLQRSGFEVRYAPMDKIYCGKQYSDCLEVDFGDLWPRSLDDHAVRNQSNLALIFDLTLVRLLPPSLVPKVYNNGNWRLSRWVRAQTGFGQVLDPVIQRWVERFRASPTAAPTYFWYHYIGTHLVPKWNRDCAYIRDATDTREAYLGQAECVLKGIARLARSLKEQNVFDNTVILVNADTGAGISPENMPDLLESYQISTEVIGQARPLLMIKALKDNEPIRYNLAPTSQIDITPTILGVAGIKDNSLGFDLFNQKIPDDRLRVFNLYYDFAWGSGSPVATDVFLVGENVKNPFNWRIVEMQRAGQAPRAFGEFSASEVTVFQRGAVKYDSPMDESGAWIAGRKFDVLLNTGGDGPKNGLFLQFSINAHNPDATIDAALDGKLIPHRLGVNRDPAAWWTTANICLPKTMSPDNNHQVTIVVSSTKKAAGNNVNLSAIVRDVRFIHDEKCLSE